MFKLFKKKQETPVEEAPVQETPVQEEAIPQSPSLGKKFAPEEFEITAVTGPLTFNRTQNQEGEVPTAALALTAWKEGDDGPIHRESAAILAPADEKLLAYLRRLAPGDSIIRLKVRQSADGTPLFLLASMPVLLIDVDLKPILEEQRTPVSTWVEGVGTFTLNRTLVCFQAEVEWEEDLPIQLAYPQGTEEEHHQAQELAKALLADPRKWDGRLRTFAAQQLVEEAGQWVAECAGEEDLEPPTVDDLAQALEVEAINLLPDQTFEFWFNGGDLFWGKTVRVSGNLTDGPTEAQGV